MRISGGSHLFQSPWPLTATYFLLSYAKPGDTVLDDKTQNYNPLVWLNKSSGASGTWCPRASIHVWRNVCHPSESSEKSAFCIFFLGRNRRRGGAVYFTRRRSFKVESCAQVAHLAIDGGMVRFRPAQLASHQNNIIGLPNGRLCEHDNRLIMGRFSSTVPSSSRGGLLFPSSFSCREQTVRNFTSFPEAFKRPDVAPNKCQRPKQRTTL